MFIDKAHPKVWPFQSPLGLILGVILIMNPLSGIGQDNELRGFVYDKNTGKAITYTNVYIPALGRGSTTNEEGFYSITDIPPGEYDLVSTYVGYDTAQKTVTIGRTEIKTINLYLEKTSIQMDEVEIRDQQVPEKTNVKVSQEKVDPKEVGKIPAIGGEPDFAQYLEVLPGVISSGDQGGNIYIRGGTPVQNKVIMDGMTIYNPFHSIGLFSVFDMEYIQSIDVYSGGFNAEYGNRISAIMDIRTRDGNKKRFAGKISGSPFTSKVQLEGPLKQWEAGEGGASFVFNTRLSYLDQTAPALYSYADSNGLPYQFQDFYGKITLTGGDGSNVKFFGFNFNDQARFQNAIDYEWDATGVGTQFRVLPSSSSATIKGNFAYSDYRINENQADQKPRFSNINGFEGGLDFIYNPNEDVIKYGIDISGFKTQYQYFNAADRQLDQTQFNTQLAGYFRYKKVLGDFVVDPSLRMQYYASLGEFSPEPRLGVKYNVSDFLRVKAAGGFYSQNLFSSRSDRDVVNLFYGFLSSPSNLPDEFNGQSVDTRLQRARHAVLGFEADLGINTSLELEGYYKNFNQIIDVNRNKIFEDRPRFSDEPDYLKKDFIVERGNAYGVDLNFRYDQSPFYFWGVYSLGVVKRDDGRMEYFPHWDRRHNLNLLGTYAFGNNQSWEVSLRWNLGSGFPFTRTKGFYEKISFGEDNTESGYETENGDLGIIFEDINEGRLPYYHRLDFSIKKVIQLGLHQKMDFTFSVINTYNRRNVFFFDRVRYIRVDQLPILPSLSIGYDF